MNWTKVIQELTEVSNQLFTTTDLVDIINYYTDLVDFVNYYSKGILLCGKEPFLR